MRLTNNIKVNYIKSLVDDLGYKDFFLSEFENNDELYEEMESYCINNEYQLIVNRIDSLGIDWKNILKNNLEL